MLEAVAVEPAGDRVFCDGEEVAIHFEMPAAPAPVPAPTNIKIWGKGGAFIFEEEIIPDKKVSSHRLGGY